MRIPHSLHSRWPLLPPSPVALEKAGGTALLCGTAEPDRLGREALGGRSGHTVMRNIRGLTRRKEGRGTEATLGRVEPYLLMVSSSSESPRLVLSSSLVIRVEELSYPARWRSSLEEPLGLWPPANINENLKSQASHPSFSSRLGPAPASQLPVYPATRDWPPSPPCSLLSLLRGRSRLNDTTDSVSVSGSRFSWLLDTLGLDGQR